MNWFPEQAREGEKAIRKQTRDVERDRRGLEREEAKLELDIKKAAKAGNKQACTVLAKQLIQLRKQKTRTYTATSQVLVLDCIYQQDLVLLSLGGPTWIFVC